MAKVYDALKRVEEERSRYEKSLRTTPHNKSSARAGWRQWFRSEHAPAQQSEAPAEVQLLQRVEALAGEVESVRRARTSSAVDLEGRIDVLRGDLARVQAELGELERRLTRTLGGTTDALRSRVAQLANRAFLALALALLALCVALLRA